MEVECLDSNMFAQYFSYNETYKINNKKVGVYYDVTMCGGQSRFLEHTLLTTQDLTKKEETELIKELKKVHNEY